ncbi:glycoside hydrolase family 53 protein [Desertivirga xinjiangensis]|uniref:glycoside hydrolase family 53 protein n=1 Tax=Desertivirga xinjiangensis TaxID=539206 RepID=UPI00210AFEC4|nr:glycosyl hydrolase 53 family protein [Pedobacter xinjiangensis]
MNKFRIWAPALVCLCLLSCKEKALVDKQDILSPVSKINSTATTLGANDFAIGVDLSSVPIHVARGAVYYDRNGVPTECHKLFKDLGANALRIRVWVNNPQGQSGKDSVIAQAIRAHNLGYRLMIDFHYSDTWADPTHQTKPAAWSGFTTLAQFEQAVYNHTYDVMDSLKDNGIYPEWVQVGNETNDGMLWNTGKASLSMSNYAALTNKGYEAVKAVSPGSKVIVHVAGGDISGPLQFIYGGLNSRGGKYDIIGVSLYPSSTGNDWQAVNNKCFANLKTLASQYNKEVMVTEIGMTWRDSVKCRAFVADIINKIRHIPNGKGLGVFYWAPESYAANTTYAKGMMDSFGRPTIATEALRDSVNMNYMLNPDFDENVSTNNPAFWPCSNGVSSTSGSYTESGGYNGGYKLTHYRNVSYSVKTYQIASNIPNGNYTLKARVKSSGGQTICQMIAKEYGALGVEKVFNIGATSTWKLIQIPNILVVNNKCKVVFYSEAGAAKWCNVDNVQLLKQ